MDNMKRVVKQLARKALRGSYDKVVIPKHYGVAVAANLKRRFPARGLKVIGVTGTNGKTTTAHLIHQMLYQAGYSTGLMTTVAHGINDKIEPQIAHMTSQSIQVTLERLSKFKQQGMDWLVLEVTSQALSQFRILGIPIDIAIMTNVTHEHLDYHGTFDNYLQAKLRLFKLAARNKSGRQLGIVNSDDDNAALFADAVPNVAAYSLDQAAGPGVAKPANLKQTPQGSRYTMKIKDDSYQITCNLPGRFNVANSLASALVGRAIGLSKLQIETGIKSLKEVEGRMMSIEEGQPFAVIVDFAHTPDSFNQLFKDMRPVVKGKLISVFGSAGRRDVQKRAMMGQIAGEYSDILVLTEEDDRDADGQEILEQIAGGAKKAGRVINQDIFLVRNRSQAIKQAFKLAKKGDTVLLLGKGHEKTIERADGEHPWDEIGLARLSLKQLNKK